jgi:hypothetical protein
VGTRSGAWAASLVVLTTLMAVGAWTLATPGVGAGPSGSLSAASTADVSGTSLLTSSGWTSSGLATGSQVVAPYSELGFGLPGSIRTGLLGSPTGGASPPALQIVMTLAFSNSSKLTHLLAQLQNPSSPAYHRYLTSGQFDAEFGAPSSVYQALVQYVESYGAQTVTTHPDRLSLEFMITPAGANALFRTTLATYTSAAGRPYFAPETSPQVPTAIAPYLLDVEGLSNYSQYTDHLAPIGHGPAVQVAAELAAGTVAGTAASTALAPGSASNPFNSTVPGANNPDALRFAAPVNKNLSVRPTDSCATAACGDFLPLPDLQVTYNLTGVYHQYGYPVNATIATLLWSDPVCHASGSACASAGYYNGWCGSQGFGGTTYAWDYYLPDVLSTWNYTIPAGEPMPTAYSLAVAGPRYGYPAGSQGFSASCDNAGAEAESTLDVAALGSLAPGANIFQVFDGTGGTSAGLAAAFADILSPSAGDFSLAAGAVSPAELAKLQNVSVITNSWTGAPFTGSTLAGWQSDLQQAVARGITVVGATGDSGSTISFPTDTGGNDYGVLGVSGTTAAINASTLLRGPPHYATGGGVVGGRAPYYGVGGGEIGWYMPAGTVAGFGSTLGGTEGVASSTSDWRPTWANGSSDASSVANAVRSGNYRFEADIAAVANDTLIDLSEGPFAFNMTCAVTTSCTAISPFASGTARGSAPTLAWTYLVGTSISDQVAGAEFAVIDHALWVAPGAVCEGYWAAVGTCAGHAGHQGWVGFNNPAIYSLGELAYSGELSLAPFYDVTLYADGGGNSTAYRAAPGYDLATGWGVVDVGNYTQNTVTYPISFSETGLPAGTSWTVRLYPTVGDAGCVANGSSCSNSWTGPSRGGPITFNQTYGTYRFLLDPVAGFTANVTAGSVRVDGADVSVSIGFVPFRFPVAFTESGLPSGTSWTVALAASTDTSSDSVARFAEPNGTYSFTVSPIPGFTVTPRSGTVAVHGAGASVALSFLPVDYSVRFVETGLPNGTTWSVSLAGAAFVSTNASGAFSEPNGSFAYGVAPIPGYAATPAGGSVRVNGTNVTVGIAFVLVTYSVVFVAAGLAPGTAWSVTVGGTPVSTTGPSLGVAEPNGSYPYAVSPIAGYTVTPNAGLADVDGASVEVFVNFTQVTYPVSFTETGLSPGTAWSVTVGGASLEGTGTTLSTNEANGSFPFSVVAIAGYSVSPAAGVADVSGAGVGVTVTFTLVAYPLDFTESGLASGTLWTVAVGGSSSAGTGSVLGFSEPNGTYPYAVAAPPGYTVTPSNGSVLVDGSAVTVPLVFREVRYSVTFTESGLPNGTSWTVAFGGAFGSTGVGPIRFSAPNGTFAYTVSPVAGYTVDPRTGSVTVDGSNATVSVAFAPVTYTLSFTESGLPSGSAWAVTVGAQVVNGSGPLAVPEANGTYTFAVAPEAGFSASPSNGTVTVAGSAVSVAIAFAPVLYAVNFTESGVPAGTTWAVTLSGRSAAGTASTLGLDAPNGTFAFTIGAVAGYAATPSSGTVTVNGAATSVGVAFTPIDYSVVFAEHGLANGTGWSVTLGGAPASTASSTIGFAEPNGTYPFAVGAVPGYTVAPSSGVVGVNGSNVTVTLAFTLVTYSIAFVEAGLSAGTFWTVSVDGDFLNASTNSSSVAEPNGSYAFAVVPVPGYTVVPGAGLVTVDGTNVFVDLTFAAVTYVVTFLESGAPVGANWTVTLNGVAETSSSASISFSEPNGSFGYSIAPLPGFRADPTSGSLSVVGGPVDRSVVFTPVTYAVSFVETGLPGGTAWWVNLTGTGAWNGTTDTLATDLANGTYTYTIGSGDRRYTAAAGGFTVAGRSLTVGIAFAPVTFPLVVDESGLPAGTPWFFNVSGVGSFSSTNTSLSIDLTNGTYGFTLGSADQRFAAPAGSFSIEGAAVNLPVRFAAVTYALTFTEEGLPNGTEWFVNFTAGGSYASSSPSIALLATNGSYGFSVAAADHRYAGSAGTVTVAGAPVAVALPFALVTYTVTVTESGLPLGASWSLNVSGVGSFGADTPTLAFTAPNGSYPYQLVSTAPGFVARPASGTFTIDGSSFGASAVFVQVEFLVTVRETGLPAGTAWTVSIAGGATYASSSAANRFLAYNGSYAFSVGAVDGYIVSPSVGTFTVSGASPPTVNVTFSPVRYPVQLVETGLTAGTVWSVTFNGTVVGSTGTADTPGAFPNGTYGFTVNPVPGYRASPPYGTVTVDGAAVSLPIVFTAVEYNVTFTESGLAPGDGWTVLLGTTTVSSFGPTIAFNETNGTFAYIVTPRAGYTVSPETGAVTVNGGDVVVPVVFVPPTATDYAVTFEQTGLAIGTPWNVTLNGTVATSTNSSDVFLEPNGIYPFAVGSVAGFAPQPAGGNVTVNGLNVTVLVRFTLFRNTVTFHVSAGLPVGKAWVAVLNGTAERGFGPNLTFEVPNGTYPYLLIGPSGHDVSGIVPTGNVTVDAPRTIPVAFTKGPTHALVFAEHGLPKAGRGVEPWCIVLEGWSVCSSKGTLTVPNLTPGPYAYSVEPKTGQEISAKIAVYVHGKLTNRPVQLDGYATITSSKGLTVALHYVFPYNVTFTETGLPDGTNWSTTFRGVTETSNNTTLVFSEPNGSYGFRIGSEPGYTRTGAPRPVVVRGGDASVTVTFRLATPRAVSPLAPALPAAASDPSANAAPEVSPLWAASVPFAGLLALCRRNRSGR